MNFYDMRGAKTADKILLSFDIQYDGVCLARTADRLLAADGTEIAAWEHVYMLRETVQGIRAFVAIADGEMEAWEALGTPLGTKS